jgi:hypothetical protein
MIPPAKKNTNNNKKMEDERIRNLLNLYFEGKTSLEEEAQLREYFIRDNLPSEWVQYRMQFLILSPDTMQNEYHKHFKDKLSAVIDKISENSGSPKKRFLLNRWWIAASLLLLTGLSLVYVFFKPASLRDTYTDSNLAYYKAQSALVYVSQKMNKGINPLGNLAKISSATANFRNIEKLNTSMNMLSFISVVNDTTLWKE